MKQIKLLKLEANNFKGAKYLNIEPNGNNISVYGDNGTGKTTIADAFFWLLFGKDSVGRSDFEIKTISLDGKPINFLDHSVYALLSVDGIEVELKKTLREKWVKQRGSLDREFKGHETDYFINGIPKSKNEYTAYIKGIADEDVFKLLTNPMYFNNTLDKKKRREMLFDMFGDVTDEDVLNSNLELFGELASELNKYSINELKSLVATNKRQIDKELQSVPNRIDELSRFIVDTGDKCVDNLRLELESVEASTKLKMDELAELKTATDNEPDEYCRKTKEEIKSLAFEKETYIENLKKDYFASGLKEQTLNNQVEHFKRQIQDNISLKDRCEKDIAERNADLDRLREEWQTVFNAKYSQNCTCPTCGQNLPQNQLDNIEKEFNATKANKLKQITDKAEVIKGIISRATEDIKTYDDNIKMLNEEIDRKNDELKNAMVNTARLQANISTVRNEYEKKMTAKINALSDYESSRKPAEATNLKRKALEDEISELKAKELAINKDMIAIESSNTFKARIAELEAEARKLSAEYERVEKLDYLIGEFTKVKSSMLEEKINSRFKLARFKLFEQQINGGIVETCEVTYNGVPYSVLNNAMRINCGIDINNAFCNHYGLCATMFIDNAESVTKIIDTECQQIRLYVSATDSKLRIEQE